MSVLGSPKTTASLNPYCSSLLFFSACENTMMFWLTWSNSCIGSLILLKWIFPLTKLNFLQKALVLWLASYSKCIHYNNLVDKRAFLDYKQLLLQTCVSQDSIRKKLEDWKSRLGTGETCWISLQNDFSPWLVSYSKCIQYNNLVDSGLPNVSLYGLQATSATILVSQDFIRWQVPRLNIRVG